MLCLDLPHLEVKFKIVKEFTFRSQKNDEGGHRVGGLDPPSLLPDPHQERIKTGEFSF